MHQMLLKMFILLAVIVILLSIGAAVYPFVFKMTYLYATVSNILSSSYIFARKRSTKMLIKLCQY